MNKEIILVKKFISLLLISVCLGDTLILKDKTKYVGTLTNFVDEEIMFEAFLSTNSVRSKFLTVIIDDIQELKLYDGTMVIDNGIIVATNAERIKNTGYDRYLNISKELKRDSEETSTEELLKHKKVKTAHILIGCGIISAAAIGGIALWFYDNFTILP